MKKLVLIDGNSLMFRSYFATAYSGKMMQTKDGKYTNALFGFINMFSKLYNDTDYIFVSFDAGKQTFRHKEYADYKGTRKPLPNELREQIPLIKEYLDILNVKRLESLDFEGDDLIACCANQFRNDFDTMLIYTGDHDLLQLVDDKINVALTKKGVGELDIYTKENFKEKMGFTPEQVIEYKGICGDTSDNLPGVKGVGDKTAIKLLESYNNIEGIYANLDKLTPKVKELFITYKEDALKSRYLATIIRDEHLDITLDDLKIKDYDKKALIKFYSDLEFTSFLRKIKEEANDVEENNELEDIEYINDYSKLQNNSYIICESFGSNYYKGTFLGLGIFDGTNYYFVKKEDCYKLKEYLENEKIYKYTFDYKQLYFTLLRIGIDIKGVIFDALMSTYLIDPTKASDDFKITIENYIDTNLPYLENIYGSNTKACIPDEKVYINYALNKVKVLSKTKNLILKEINDYELEFLDKVELDLSRTLAKMEYNGLLIDSNHLQEIGQDFKKQANEIEKKIYEISGTEFNINSPKQLGDVLFEKLGLPHGKKNKTGYSTSVDVLEKLAMDYEIARLILDYRAYTKLVSTYVNGMYDLMDNNYIHPLYKQALTNTGRLSSIEPNIQNMPIRTERGQVIREVFISRFPNGKIISADYSQIELRILASMSNDPNMVKAFNEGIDIHTHTASQVYEVDINEVTKEMRRTSKAINFGIIYGMSSWGLSEQLGISQRDASNFINKYFENFKLAKETLDGFISSAVLNGYSKTLFGRRRYIPELNDKNKAVVQFGERTAMNSPIQGTAADIIKIAMNKVQDRIEREHLKAIMIAQVHDELVFDVPSDEVDIIKNLVKEEMERAVKLNVKLISEVGVGDNWFLAH